MNYFFALLFIALNPLFTWASGPNDSQKSTIRCPAPEDLSAVHLYGLWHAEVDGQPTPQSVQFVRHPENTGSVRGQVTRDGVTVQVAGDVDNGELSLEESKDGQHISATWQGMVVPTSCGKEIRGSWNNALDNTSTPFVLCKAPGWQ